MWKHHALFSRYHTLRFQIALVPYKHHGNLCPSVKALQNERIRLHTYIIRILDPHDLLSQLVKICEGDHARDWKDQKKALTALHVKIPHCRKLLSSCCIQYLEHTLLSIHFHLFSIWVFNGRVVSFDKDRLNELNCLKKAIRPQSPLFFSLSLPRLIYQHRLIPRLPTCILSCCKNGDVECAREKGNASCCPPKKMSSISYKKIVGAAVNKEGFSQKEKYQVVCDMTNSVQVQKAEEKENREGRNPNRKKKRWII